MEDFISNDFLLYNDTAKNLYHEHASNLPIIDYHCHLSPADIADDRRFNNITEAWLEGDHYKWRAMRADGTQEKFCSGDASARDKFLKWAETVPMTIGNPLYHWSHLELKRYFKIGELLGPDTAADIWDRVNEQISRDDFSARGLLKKMNVEVICTTDDPVDSLENHKSIQESDFEVKVLPTFRPDNALGVENPGVFTKYLETLSELSTTNISSFDHFMLALAKRVDHFSLHGCKISDHAFTSIPYYQYNLSEVRKIFNKLLGGTSLSLEEVGKFKLAVMHELGGLYSSSGWSMQIHLGALRNNNTRLFNQYGPDAGCDSIGDQPQAEGLSRFLDGLDKENKLPPTILYNLNPSDNELMASMAGNFSACMAGKMQYGAAWWFLDQKNGIRKQIGVLANFGLLGRFIGMLTDSRSFLSYPRHEYFRRIFCNMVGEYAESGEYPHDMQLLSSLVENVSYYNVRNYFNFK